MLTPTQRMQLAHAIARHTVERCEFDEDLAPGERIDYRATFGACLRLTYEWERMCGAVYWSGLELERVGRPYPRHIKPIARVDARRQGARWVVELPLRPSGFIHSNDVLTLDLEAMTMTLHLDARAQNLTGEDLCEAWGVTVAPVYVAPMEDAA